MRRISILVLAFGALAAPALADTLPARALHAAPSAVNAFLAPRIAPANLVRLEAPLEKVAPVPVEDDLGRARVGRVRPLSKAARVAQWVPAAGGFVARISVTSEDAAGLRVGLDVSRLGRAIDARIQGSEARIERMTIDPAQGAQAWLPWTAGATQVIELSSPARPAEDAVQLESIVHFDVSPFAKAAGECTVPTSCSTDDPALDAAMAQVKNAVMKINFIDGAGAFMCSATLINTDKFPQPYVVTANHCINNASASRSVTSWWFYETLGCAVPTGIDPASVQVAGGMQLVFGNDNVDGTLLLMNNPPPAGAVFAGWTEQRLPAGTRALSLSHPQGDTRRLAVGTVNREYRIIGRPQDMYGVRFSRGIIQGGSSGSGLFTLSGNTLRLAGVLSGTTVREPGGMSCTNLTEDALYGRLELFIPQVKSFISNAAAAADDAPNRPQDLFATAPGTPLDRVPGGIALDNRRIDYAGDLDVYRFELSVPAYVSAWTQGANLDTVGSILDSRGVSIEAEDDAQLRDFHFGITRRLLPGTYYVQVGHWEASGTGAYDLRIRADAVDENYTDLWWNATEPGWGLNLSHQGNTLFATLYTYDRSGAPMWLVMSDGARQPDGSYLGTLYRARSGGTFSSNPFPGAALDPVGTMRIAFAARDDGTLTYTVDGAPVTKAISRNVFSTPPSCTWSAFDRSTASNYQDIWWNPAEPGWGVAFAHQGDILFATLYTFDSAGRPMWLVMSLGQRSGSSYSGPLYRVTGPAFDASPWGAATALPVGTMTVTFTDGNRATLSYSVDGTPVSRPIERNTFGMPKTRCES